MMLVAVLCVSSTVWAAGNQPTTAKWEGNINVSKLSQFLRLTSEQTKEVANISDYLNDQLSEAASSSKRNDELTRKAIYGNLKLMKQTLTPEQYAKYTQLVNITLNNKGIQVK